MEELQRRRRQLEPRAKQSKMYPSKMHQQTAVTTNCRVQIRYMPSGVSWLVLENDIVWSIQREEKISIYICGAPHVLWILKVSILLSKIWARLHNQAACVFACVCVSRKTTHLFHYQRKRNELSLVSDGSKGSGTGKLVTGGKLAAHR